MSKLLKAISLDSLVRNPVNSAVAIGSVTSIAVLFLWNSSKKRALRRKCRELQLRKQKEREIQFATLRSKYKLNEECQKILKLTWDELIEKLQSRELKAVQVLKAFIAQALEVTSRCNAISEFNPKAMKIAEELDKLPQVKGPLHGVPFAVKDDTNLIGMDSTLGYAKNCFKPQEKSAVLVQTLEKCGGIPFCKTNVPQSLLTIGSDNPIFGETTNIINDKLGPGGSSSGSGALVGGFGSFFGTGSDLAGSVRIPAFFNGVSALKATSGRMSSSGVSAILENLLGLEITVGIIGWNASVVAAVFKAILKNNHVQTKLDPTIPPCAWNEELYSSKRKLRIGYFTSMDFFHPIGDTIETVEKAVKTLERQGHVLIPMKVPDGSKIMKIGGAFIFADQNKNSIEFWKGEEVAKSMKLNASLVHLPTFIIKLLRFLINRPWLLPGMYSPRLRSMVGVAAESSLDMWDTNGELKEIKTEVLDEWSRLNLDCCICPVLPFPAIPKDVLSHVAVGTVYTFLWNVVDFPAGVVKKFGVESGKNIHNYEDQGDQTLKLVKKACQGIAHLSLPIGIQVASLPYQEEIVLRVMEELENNNDS